MRLPETCRRVVSALRTCPDIAQFNQILAQATTSGLWLDGFVAARLIAFSATLSAGDLRLARLIFDLSDQPTAFAFNSLIRGYSSSSHPAQALHLFVKMLQSGIYADKFVFPFVLKACARASLLFTGRALHGQLVKCGVEGDVYVETSLMHMYAGFGCLGCSKSVFDEMPERSTVTWNAVLACYLKSRMEVEGLGLFEEMVKRGVEVNEDTLVSVLACCASAGGLMVGRSVHGFLIRRCMDCLSRVELDTSLVHMYVKCGDLDGGLIVFERMDVRDVSAWTVVIGGLAMHGYGQEALAYFRKMVQSGMKPDCVTFTNVLHACSHAGLVSEGLQAFHEMVDGYGIEARMEHYGCIVDLFGRAGLLKEAVRFIDTMPLEPNEVVWCSLMNACLVNGEIGLYEQVRRRGSAFGSDGAQLVAMSNVHAKAGRWDEVTKVREMMVEKGMKKTQAYSSIEIQGEVRRFLVGDTINPCLAEMLSMLEIITQQAAFI